MQVTLEQLDEVEHRIQSARDWSARARKALEGRAGVPEVRALLQEGAALDVTVGEEERLAQLVKTVDWWTKRASSAFLKRGCEITLLQVLRGRLRRASHELPMISP